MSEIAIKCEHLSKRYRIGENDSFRTLRDVISDGVASPFRRLRASLSGNGASRNGSSLSSESDSALSTQHSALRTGLPSPVSSPALPEPRNSFLALDDVSFEVKRGEVVGIIGANGAGKSTLLKILSRITKPTTGRAQINGRVGSLLEVGTGFHPELSGRENIYLNAAILGMRKAEVKSKFDEIVAFAEIDRFIDTPVKRYSSGMYVRLAFAVAAHLEPEILIVDEVLAVGDAQFQKKCLGRMKEVGQDGRTVLFVSHNMAAISTLCSKAALLKAGRLELIGDVRNVVGNYLVGADRENFHWRPHTPSNGAFRYDSVRVTVDTDVIPNEGITADSDFNIVFEYSISSTIPPGRLSFLLTNQEGMVVLTSSNTDATDGTNQRWPLGRIVNRCRIPGHLLAPGRYYLTISEPMDNGTNIIHENITSFTISEQNSLVARDGRQGVVVPLLSWSQESNSNES